MVFEMSIGVWISLQWYFSNLQTAQILTKAQIHLSKTKRLDTVSDEI